MGMTLNLPCGRGITLLSLMSAPLLSTHALLGSNFFGGSSSGLLGGHLVSECEVPEANWWPNWEGSPR